jgi:hypothetical protein
MFDHLLSELIRIVKRHGIARGIHFFDELETRVYLKHWYTPEQRRMMDVDECEYNDEVMNSFSDVKVEFNNFINKLKILN